MHFGMKNTKTFLAVLLDACTQCVPICFGKNTKFGTLYSSFEIKIKCPYSHFV